MKYTPSTNSIKSMNVQTAQPLDIKDWFEDLTDLEDVTIGNNPLSYYEGMLAKNVDTGQIYRWIENTEGLISGGYTYGTYEHDGVVYTGRTFNFVDVANRALIFDHTETFPPIDLNYPQGTIAFVEIFDDPDYNLDIYKKTDNALPGTWSKVIELIDVSSSTTVEAIIRAVENDLAAYGGGIDIGYGSGTWTARDYKPLEETAITKLRQIKLLWAGSGGNYGVATTPARSDHDHGIDGLLYRGDLDVTDSLLYLTTQSGIFHIPDGSDVPFEGFPDDAAIGYTPGVTDSFIMKEYSIASSGTGVWILRTMEDGEGLICFQYYQSSIWKAWTRYEATQVEILTGTSKVRVISPYNLRDHETAAGLSLAAYNWTGTLYIRELTNGLIHLWGEVAGGTATDFIIHALSDSKYHPDTTVKKPAVYSKSTDYLTGLVQIDTSGNISARGYVNSGEERLGTFIFDFFYEIEV